MTKGKECDCRIESSDCFCVNQKKEEKKKECFYALLQLIAGGIFLVLQKRLYFLCKSKCEGVNFELVWRAKTFEHALKATMLCYTSNLGCGLMWVGSLSHVSWLEKWA